MNLKEILLIEDDEGDVVLISEALSQCEVRCKLTAAETGEKALELLKQGLRPDLILLDLNLPGRDGFEVTAELRHDDRFAMIPILMLTTSQAQRDVDRAYRTGVNCYLVKPMDLQRLIELADKICRFWFVAARLPSKLL